MATYPFILLNAYKSKMLYMPIHVRKQIVNFQPCKTIDLNVLVPANNMNPQKTSKHSKHMVYAHHPQDLSKPKTTLTKRMDLRPSAMRMEKVNETFSPKWWCIYNGDLPCPRDPITL